MRVATRHPNQRLEKENLRTEARIATTSKGDEESGTGTVVASSASLREDVEEVRRRVEKFQKRREGLGVQDAESAREEVVKCYRYVLYTRSSKRCAERVGGVQIPSKATVGLLARG